MVDYVNGARRGMFDKCNGRPLRLDSRWSIDYAEGYLHAYHCHERRI